MTGNYTYKKDALKAAIKYTNDKKVLTDSTFSHLEIFTIGKNENLSPSKWQTDIYFPIKPKVVAPVYKRIANDSIAAVPKQQPAVKPQEVKTPSVKTSPVKTPTTIKEKEPSNIRLGSKCLVWHFPGKS